MWGKSGYYLTVQLKEDEAKDTSYIHLLQRKKKTMKPVRTIWLMPCWKFSVIIFLCWKKDNGRSYSWITVKKENIYIYANGDISSFNHENYSFSPMRSKTESWPGVVTRSCKLQERNFLWNSTWFKTLIPQYTTSCWR